MKNTLFFLACLSMLAFAFNNKSTGDNSAAGASDTSTLRKVYHADSVQVEADVLVNDQLKNSEAQKVE